MAVTLQSRSIALRYTLTHKYIEYGKIRSKMKGTVSGKFVIITKIIEEIEARTRLQ